MNPENEANRQVGSPIPRRRYVPIPTKPGALEWVRIQKLFLFLLHSEYTRNEALETFTHAAMEWAKTFPIIGPACHHIASEWIKRFFLIDNPSLVPLLLVDFHYQEPVPKFSTGESVPE